MQWIFRNMRISLLALVTLMAAGASVSAHAASLTLRNNCSYTVYPGVYPASLYSNGGWSMAPGTSVTFNITGSGRIWGRTGCNSASPAQCTTGQCGGIGLQCAGTTGVPNTSLFEFTINASGTDWYNVSYVDAIDNTITVATSNTSCVNPSTCSEAVKTNCPAGLRSGSVCLSPCTRYNTDQFCCRGAFGTPETCNTSQWTAEAQTYLNNVHQYCPYSYAYAYDEPSGALRTCPTGTTYTVSFCGSSNGGTYNRFESHNYPGHFIRHAFSRGRIDANVNPAADAQWRVVPGLAGAGVSFESVNFPGRYLRHRNAELWMDVNDNSVLFRADATWHQRAGLANSSLMSFESHNFPGRYIRHRGYQLYNEAVSDTLGRNDATFRRH